MWRYLELLSFRSLSEIAKWRVEVTEGRNPRDIKVLLAQEIVARFHSQRDAETALTEFEARFQRGVLPDDMPEISVAASDGSIAVPQLLRMADLVSSASEAIRMIQQGAVKLDGERINDRADIVEAGRVVVAQVGKRKFARITVI